ncbi:unnamed protein product [Phaeothamnion confervicola]
MRLSASRTVLGIIFPYVERSGSRISMSAPTVASRSTLLGNADFFARCDLVLASASPRRKEIFGLMQLSPRVVISDFEENLDKKSFARPEDYAVTNARCKAAEVAARLFADRRKAEDGGGGAQNLPVVVVGADTIVDLDGEILEKPRDEQEAHEVLSRLSGRQHLVHSGVAVFTAACGAEQPAAEFCATTRVAFASLSAGEIAAYIKSGEPMDKAGSYGIQGLGGQMVTGVEGCYFNVMGFPFNRFAGTVAALIAEGKV